MKTYFLHNIRNARPFIEVYSIVLTLGLIINRILSSDFFWNNDFQNRFEDYILMNIKDSVVISFFAAFFVALVMFSYLQTSRSCSFIHSLPMKRSKLLTNNLLSGLLVMYIPNLAAFSVLLIYSSVKGAALAGEIALLLLIISLEELVFFLIAALAFLIMGSVFASIIMYLVFCFGGYLLLFILSVILEVFTFGYHSLDNAIIDIRNLSPVLFYDKLNVHIDYSYENVSYGILKIDNLTSFFVCSIVAAVILICLCYLAYRNRKSENAGNFIALDGMKKVIAVVFSVLATSFTTMILMGDFYDNSYPAKYMSGTKVFMVLHFLIYGFIFFEISWMIIEKSRRVFVKHLVQSLVFSAAMAVTGVILIFVSGYIEEYIPDKSDINSITINGTEQMTAFSTDSELIDDLRELHGNLISLKSDIQVNDEKDCSLVIFYELSDGSEIIRDYFIRREALDGEIDKIQKDRIVELLLHTFQYDEVTISFGSFYTQMTITDISKVNKIYDAMVEDMRAGRLRYVDSISGPAETSVDEWSEADSSDEDISISLCFMNTSGQYRELFDDVNPCSEKCWINKNCTSTLKVCRELLGGSFINMLEGKEAVYDIN